jgi:hypothetical protein
MKHKYRSIVKAKYKSRITGMWVYKSYKSIASFTRAKRGLFAKKKLRLVKDSYGKVYGQKNYLH